MLLVTCEEWPLFRMALFNIYIVQHIIQIALPLGKQFSFCNYFVYIHLLAKKLNFSWWLYIDEMDYLSNNMKHIKLSVKYITYNQNLIKNVCNLFTFIIEFSFHNEKLNKSKIMEICWCYLSLQCAFRSDSKIYNTM